jgi:hypothetical protein
MPKGFNGMSLPSFVYIKVGLDVKMQKKRTCVEQIVSIWHGLGWKLQERLV